MGSYFFRRIKDNKQINYTDSRQKMYDSLCTLWSDDEDRTLLKQYISYVHHASQTEDNHLSIRENERMQLLLLRLKKEGIVSMSPTQFFGSQRVTFKDQEFMEFVFSFVESQNPTVHLEQLEFHENRQEEQFELTVSFK